MSDNPFGRVITAMVTPMHDDGSIDYDGLQRLAVHLADHGHDGLLVNGTTGESATTTDDEDYDAVAAVVEEVAEPVAPVVEDVAETVAPVTDALEPVVAAVAEPLAPVAGLARTALAPAQPLLQTLSPVTGWLPPDATGVRTQPSSAAPPPSDAPLEVAVDDRGDPPPSAADGVRTGASALVTSTSTDADGGAATGAGDGHHRPQPDAPESSSVPSSSATARSAGGPDATASAGASGARTIASWISAAGEAATAHPSTFFEVPVSPA